jgi:hypothetical protein
MTPDRHSLRPSNLQPETTVGFRKLMKIFD